MQRPDRPVSLRIRPRLRPLRRCCCTKTSSPGALEQARQRIDEQLEPDLARRRNRARQEEITEIEIIRLSSIAAESAALEAIAEAKPIRRKRITVPPHSSFPAKAESETTTTAATTAGAATNARARHPSCPSTRCTGHRPAPVRRTGAPPVAAPANHTTAAHHHRPASPTARHSGEGQNPKPRPPKPPRPGQPTTPGHATPRARHPLGTGLRRYDGLERSADLHDRPWYRPSPVLTDGFPGRCSAREPARPPPTTTAPANPTHSSFRRNPKTTTTTTIHRRAAHNALGTGLRRYGGLKRPHPHAAALGTGLRRYDGLKRPCLPRWMRRYCGDGRRAVAAPANLHDRRPPPPPPQAHPLVIPKRRIQKPRPPSGPRPGQHRTPGTRHTRAHPHAAPVPAWPVRLTRGRWRHNLHDRRPPPPSPQAHPLVIPAAESEKPRPPQPPRPGQPTTPGAPASAQTPPCRIRHPPPWAAGPQPSARHDPGSPGPPCHPPGRP